MLDRGTILEKGSHDELMKSVGVITICTKRKWKAIRVLNMHGGELVIFTSSFIDEHVDSLANYDS